MDPAMWGLHWQFLAGGLSIILINLVLSGDNAVLIALAVHSLPRRQRQAGIILGAGAAVVLRVALTFFVAQLLEIQFVRLMGGVFIAWIAVRLLTEGSCEGTGVKCGGFLHAMWIILAADLTMSLDNVLAIAGASHGSLLLLIFGLALSIPIVIFTSSLLTMLMDRYPVILYIGAAILGKVAAELILGDPAVAAWLHPAPWFSYTLQAVCAVGVMAAGNLWLTLSFRQAGRQKLLPEQEISGDG